MKIYCVTYDTSDPKHDAIVTHQEFTTSDGDASKRCTSIKANVKDLVGKPERVAIDIPTTRAELVEWLNKNASVAGVELQ